MVFNVGSWRIDPVSRAARKDGTTRRLSPRAVRLLSVLGEAEGATLERDELLEKVWPNVTVGDESLTQVVAEVRRTLDEKRLIETIARGGYRLTQPFLRHVAGTNESPLREPPCPFDLDARALCIEARAEMVNCGSGSIQRAEALTAEAVELAPECAATRADRAVALVRSHLYWSEGRNLLPLAISEAELSVTLDPVAAAGHSALGYAYAAAEHWKAAEAEHRRALAADPRNPSCYHFAAWFLMSRRRYRAAIAYFEQVGDLEPQNIKGYLHAAQLTIHIDPARSRRNAEKALRRARQRLDTDPADMRALTATASLMAFLGEPGAAFSAMKSIDASESAQGIYHASTLAMIGEVQGAIVAFEALFDHGWRDVHWLDADPAFTNIANDRKFKRLRRGLAVA
ncbi:MAG: winged helix-turn-helix domain-containing protein [Pseudomonadota bacterium]